MRAHAAAARRAEDFFQSGLRSVVLCLQKPDAMLRTDGTAKGRVRADARRGTRRRLLVAWLSLLFVSLTTASSARADDRSTTGPLRWDPAWTHAGPADYALTIFGVGDVLIYEPFLQNKQPPLLWTKPILFDVAVRNLLRGSTPAARSEAATVSWGFFGLVLAYPVIDIPVAGKRYGAQLAWDLAWQDATTISLATAFDLNLRDLFGRARPPVWACLQAGGSTTQCLGTSGEATRSFPGGHVLMVTAAAALTCTQHLSMHLYGAPWDAIVCAAAIAADTTVGVLRIVTDDHWASDILAGGLLGTAFGWAVPTLMHLRATSTSPTGVAAHLAPIAIPIARGGGAGVTGWF